MAEAGIRPRVVAGTSVGAVNAVWLARYPDQVDGLAAVWIALRARDVFPGSHLRIAFNVIRHQYVHDSRAWERFLRGHVEDARFEDLSIPAMVVAVRVSDGSKEVFDSGEILPALMASTAIPGVFPPYRIGDELYVDGGVLEHLPVPTLLERGVTEVYAVDCSGFALGLDFRGSMVDRCWRIAATASALQSTSLFATRGRKVHLIRPDIPEIGDARQFAHAAHLVDSGYAFARRYLEQRGVTWSFEPVDGGAPAESS
jgi:NTE family protein